MVPVLSVNTRNFNNSLMKLIPRCLILYYVVYEKCQSDFESIYFKKGYCSPQRLTYPVKT